MAIKHLNFFSDNLSQTFSNSVVYDDWIIFSKVHCCVPTHCFLLFEVSRFKAGSIIHGPVAIVASIFIKGEYTGLYRELTFGIN